MVGNKLLAQNGREIEVKTIEKVSLDSPVKVYNLEVDLSHNYYVQLPDGSSVLVHNKLTFGDGGNASTTRYVGSLYEEDDNRGSKFIFLGGTRVASVTNGKVFYYHADHLGGTNVLTDDSGVRKELIEYEPFGSTSKHEKYGSSEETAWYYFTGKPLDDETGLMYFGARYYDPRLGRFITADLIVQDPYDSQTLNRYSYTSNNPVNRVDPDGRSWSKFWKKVWKAIEKPLIAAVTAAVVVFTWGAAAPALTGMAALFSTSGFVTVASAAATTAVLQTHEGQRFIRFLGDAVFDKALGFAPRVAGFLGNMAAYMTVNTTFQFGFARVAGANKTVEAKDFDANSPTDQTVAKEILQEGNGVNYGTRPGINPKTGQIENLDKILYSGDEAVGVAAKALDVGGKAQHLGVVMKGLKMQADMGSFLASPIDALKSVSQGYLSFGISHTAVNISLLNSGYATTINSLLPGGWTTLPSTFVYGPYGGGLTGAIAHEKIRK